MRDRARERDLESGAEQNRQRVSDCIKYERTKRTKSTHHASLTGYSYLLSFRPGRASSLYRGLCSETSDSCRDPVLCSYLVFGCGFSTDFGCGLAVFGQGSDPGNGRAPAKPHCPCPYRDPDPGRDRVLRLVALQKSLQVTLVPLSMRRHA